MILQITRRIVGTGLFLIVFKNWLLEELELSMAMAKFGGNILAKLIKNWYKYILNFERVENLETIIKFIGHRPFESCANNY